MAPKTKSGPVIPEDRGQYTFFRWRALIMINEAEINSTTEEVEGSIMDHPTYFEEPAAILISRLTIEVTLAFIGLLGNAMVLFVISRQSKFRSGLKVFIGNLALADIGILTISFPIAVAKEQLPFHWPFGKVFCLYFYPLAEVFLGVSVWSVTAIAIERYRRIATKTAVRGSPYISTKPLKWALVLIWIVSFLVVSFPLLFVMDFVEDVNAAIFCVMRWSKTVHSIYIVSMFIFWYLLPMGAIIFTYVQISRQLQLSNRFHRSSIRGRSKERKLENSIIRSSEEQKRMRQNSKAKKILTPIVLVFAISMLPLNALRILLLFSDDFLKDKYFFVAYNVCVIGVVINSASDPVIYSIVSNDFRVELKAMLFRVTQSLRNLVKIKATDRNANILNTKICQHKQQEGQFSPEQAEKSLCETPQSLLVTPV